MSPMMHAWSLADFGFMFVMWAVMMVAMMLPSATPMILLFAQTTRKQLESATPYGPTAAFMWGYLAVWTLFSAIATLANWALHSQQLLSSMMGHATPKIAGALLIAAGIFQWTPLKTMCLKHCRSPLAFLVTHLRTGLFGAFLTGMHHGAFCVGCCWLLMGLLFALGVMNLAWVAALAVFVLLEKALPAGEFLARTSGVGLVAWGLWLLFVN
jgi:predicted metal-binding membrane protein